MDAATTPRLAELPLADEAVAPSESFVETLAGSGDVDAQRSPSPGESNPGAETPAVPPPPFTVVAPFPVAAASL